MECDGILKSFQIMRQLDLNHCTYVHALVIRDYVVTHQFVMFALLLLCYTMELFMKSAKMQFHFVFVNEILHQQDY